MNRQIASAALALCVGIVAAGCTPPDASRSTRLTEAYLDVVALEDARPLGATDIARLRHLAGSSSSFVRAAAVRALGRLERPRMAGTLTAALEDPHPDVRRAAAVALAQAHHTSDGTPAMAPLLARLEVEEDPAVLGAIAESVGRLRVGASARARIVDALVGLSRTDRGDAPPDVMVGVALGLESASRLSRGEAVTESAAARLHELVLYRDGTRERIHEARVRSLALTVLGQSGRMTAELIRVALRAEREAVHVAAARWLGTVDPATRAETLRRVMFSRSLPAQIEGLGYIAGQPPSALHCSYLRQAATPPSGDVEVPTALRTLAIDALRRPCPDRADQRRVLRAAADPAQLGRGPWQPPAHAVLALAEQFPADAAAVLPTYLDADNPFVRAWGARAAAALADRTALESLMDDPDPNVRTAALGGLASLPGRPADAHALDQLDAEDPQLLMTAAGVLEGTAMPGVAPALLDAFDRVSATGSETARDARRALLARAAEVGDETLAHRLRPYLTDYDPVVATEVAQVLEAWTGRPSFATPVPAPRMPLPTAADMERMSEGTVVLHMADGGEIHIELHPWVATTNTWRFVRLVEEGWFDGLTFHRWAPNFVIQGGSPNANEYFGDAAFSRDEVGLHHWRGTVGISTRGHDTGDGQIFVNLQDNVRLDHVYTIVGTVVEGMDVVDRVHEGSVIERAEVRPGS